MPRKPILVLLALGAFAVGTDGFVINGLLLRIASAMHVTEATAGQLVTVFALVYALASPVLATITSRVPRRPLLVSAMALFVVANLLAAVAGAYWVIMTARVLAALAAAGYMGPAIAAAAGVAPEQYRGRALAVVAGGLTVATALGVPIGSLVGAVGSWRFTLVLVAAIAAVAAIGIAAALPDLARPPKVALADRLRVIGQRPVLIALFANVFAVAGTFEVFTYIAPLADRTTPLGSSGLTVVLLAWGVAAVLGNPLGGRSSDRYGAHRTFGTGVALVCVVLVAIGLFSALAPSGQWVSSVLLVLLTAALSVVAWALPPPQTHRIVQLAPDVPAIVTSINSSATYLGLSFGGAVGGYVLDSMSATALGWVGAGLEVIALVLVLPALRKTPVTTTVTASAETANAEA